MLPFWVVLAGILTTQVGDDGPPLVDDAPEPAGAATEPGESAVLPVEPEASGPELPAAEAERGEEPALWSEGDSAEDVVTTGPDVATAALEACLALEDTASPEFAACFESVRSEHPGTPAAQQAEGALRLLARLPPPSTIAGQPTPRPIVVEPERTGFLSPGRLELAGTLGTYGLALGGAVGLLALINDQSSSTNLHLHVLFSGASVLVGTAAFGALGFQLASWLDLDLQHVWAMLGGALWGGSYSLASLPIFYASIPNPRWGSYWLIDELTLLTPLLGAAIGMGAGLGLALWLDPTTAEVSEVNTGGLIGAPFGALLGLNIIAWNPGLEPLPAALIFSLSYGITMTGGLLVGAIASQVLDLTWGEVLIQDFGAFLGMVALTAPTWALFASPSGGVNRLGEDGWKIQVSSVSAAAVVGTTAGFVATTAGLAAWRAMNGEPYLRDDIELPAFMSLALAPTVAIDHEQELAPAFALVVTF